jgi:hypothetical protein
VVANNVVWNNGDGNIGSNAAGLTLIGNIEADPKFVGDGRYELKTGSPAIGRATRTATMIPYDIIGVARGSQPDVGAYQSK